MTMITVNNLYKTFKVRRHHTGRFAAVRNFTTRDFRLVEAVNRISFAIEPGELVGYLGPNGAGKSTTIKMLTGLLVPTAGHLEVNGFIPWQDRKHFVKRIGVVFGQRTTLWWDLPVTESLSLLQHIYDIPKDAFNGRLATFTELLDLGPFMDAPVRSLSLGQRMRADICAALLHQPDILFLDEPTIGLDVVAKERIRSFIQYANLTFGTTIILTTHDLADVARLCARILIVDQGQLLYDGSLDELQTRFGGQRELVVDFAEHYETVTVAGASLKMLTGDRAVLGFERGTVSASELIGRLSATYRIRDLSVREPDVEATIRRIYEEQLLQL